MDGYINEDFLTLPLVLDSSEFQSVVPVSYSNIQLELSKQQSFPLVLIEEGDILTGDCLTDCPLILPNSVVNGQHLEKDETHSNSISKEEGSDKQRLEISTCSQDNSDTSNLSDAFNDLIEKVVTYKCKLCSFKSSDKSALSSHLREIHFKEVKQTEDTTVRKDKKNELPEKMAYMCGKCSEAFGSFSDWRVHIATVHKIVMNVKTILENTTLNGGSPIDLKIDKNEPKEDTKKVVIMPKKDKKIACSIRSCLVRLSSRDLVKKHQECHAGPRHFACPQCSQPFRRWSDCANHLWSAHSQDIDLYSCPTCTYKTALRTKFKNHIKIHSDEREYMCSDCGKTFKQFVQLKNHQVSHLKAIGSPDIPNWSKKQECPQCKRSFYDGKSLKKHIQSVHSNLRPYVCQVCGHTSASKNRLGIHLRQHTGEKPFSCPICDFITGDQNCLRRHVWRHSHVRPYSCPHCSYSCIQSNSLKNHIKAQHPGASGVLSCIECSFTSLSQSTLDSHIAKAHTTSNEDKESTEAKYAGDGGAKTSTGSGQHSTEYPAVMIDEESQNCFEVPVVDTGGITIPAD